MLPVASKPIQRQPLRVLLGLCLSGLWLTVACGAEEGTVFAVRAAPESGRLLKEEPDAGVAKVDASRIVERAVEEAVEEQTPFVDLSCPGSPSRTPIYLCDPWAEDSGCERGQGCFPLVIYPNGPCEVERFGAVCRTAGVGTQGQPCAGQGCASGHLCVTTMRGSHCARTCSLTGEPANLCEPGLLCQPIDIDGFGSCL